MIKSKIFEFDPVVYPYTLLVTKNFDWKELEDRFYQVVDKRRVVPFDENLRPSPTTYAKSVIVLDKITEMLYLMILLYPGRKITVGTIAHESGHITTFLGDWLGFPNRTPENDEPFAYYEEFVADCVDSVLKNKPDKKHGKVFE